MYKLASSVWSRSGYNQQNNALLPYNGPKFLKIMQKIKLPSITNVKSYTNSSIVVCEDNSYRIAYKGHIVAIGSDNSIKWSKKIVYAEYYSSLVALNNNRTLVYTEDTIFIYSSDGNIELRKKLDVMFDDTLISPNVTYDGYIALGTIGCQVNLISHESSKVLSTQGYDVVSPAISKNNEIVISDNFGLGLSSFTIENKKIFANKNTLRVDMLPMINSKNIIAIGSKNDECSYFMDNLGSILYTSAFPAVYTEYIDGGWIELSHNQLRRLSNDYKEVWKLKINKQDIWGLDLPIVDKAGDIFLATKYQLICVNKDGIKSQKLKFQKNTHISMLGHQSIGFINKGYLHIIK